MNNQKKCTRCGETKFIEDFYELYSTCITCSKEHRKNYDDGINADLDKLAPHSREAVKEARELLELMGYDLNKDIHTQFKNRIKVLYDMDLENIPKRPKNPLKRFI